MITGLTKKINVHNITLLLCFITLILVVYVLCKTNESFFGSKNNFDSAKYWEKRYATGDNSGSGSYGKLAEYKAKFINKFVVNNGISSVIEFGVGDGAQLKLANYPSYIGVDISNTILRKVSKTFASDNTKTFMHTSEYKGEKCDLAMSLDVIFHLVEDDVFNEHMQSLFDSSTRFVIIYSSKIDFNKTSKHVRHREFTKWISKNAPKWKLAYHERNPFYCDPKKNQCKTNDKSFANFFVFSK